MHVIRKTNSKGGTGNMKKKVLGIILTAAIAMSLAACGSSSAAKTTSSAASSKASDTSTVESVVESVAESAASEGTTSAKTASGDVVTVGFSQVGAESDWRTANTTSMKNTFSSANGYNLIFDDAQQKQENQITAIRNFIQQEVDYIVLAPVTETGWDTVLQEAKDADIPVIIVDRMVNVSDDSLYTAWVGSNFKLEGQKACAWLKAYAEAKNIAAGDLHIVDIQGTIGASAQIGRSEGMSEAAKANGWDLLASESGEFTQAKGQEVMESFIKQYDNINVVYCENDNEAFGAIDALTAAGKTVGGDIANGQVMVMSFDSTKAGLTDTLSGQITLNTECNPLHGPRVQKIIETLKSGGTPDKTAYVDEEMFSADKTVTSVTVDGADYKVTELTQDVLSARAY